MKCDLFVSLKSQNSAITSAFSVPARYFLYEGGTYFVCIELHVVACGDGKAAGGGC